MTYQMYEPPIRVAKVTIILEDEQGGQITFYSDEFDSVDIDSRLTDPPTLYSYPLLESYQSSDREFSVNLHRVRKYTIGTPRENPVEIEDPNVVESDGDGR